MLNKNKNLSFVEIEEKILKFWGENRIFEKSISQRKNSSKFSFYDGPPFATGKPHYGHILATTIKDTVLRYQTMRGYNVSRRVGWDCHGLPVENLIEKELGFKNKREIEKFGIGKFNQACRASVFRCVKDFELILKRVGRWADYRKAYSTMERDYIESVWWVLYQLWEKDLVYKDYKVSPYCSRCGTPLSNFEVNQGYKEIKENSIYLKFKIKDSSFKNSFFLVWTTTPWTLPNNLALAINPTSYYIIVKQGDENLILAQSRKSVLKGHYSVIKKISGRDIIGLRYEPIFDFFKKTKIKNIENGFKVLPASFVSLLEGTGIVHIAPMHGDDDFQLGKKFNLPLIHLIDESGFFKTEAGKFAGQFIKNVDSKIIDDLSKRALLYNEEEVLHSYPFCWRCDTPLIYYALETWYIAVKKIKKELIKNNKKILWVPYHVKEGRFGMWLEDVKDWAFSRNRFWGAPIPIWQCKTCKNIKIISSFKELEKLSKRKIKDPHRPYIDEITFKCGNCNKGIMKRVSEVFDCWFESGSMPYAQWHYPFKNKSLVEETFPADFIAEGIDQTRGWFYTLHVIATALTLKNIGLKKSQPAFKNVIVNGLILDAQGRKLSKKLKNYPEPSEIFNRYGADSLRYFLLTSTPVGEDYRFSSERVEEVFRKVISTLWHSFCFFNTYKDKDFKPKDILRVKRINLLDRWIISRLNRLNKEVIYYLEQYELTKAIRLFDEFIDDFSNWYIRRSRKKFQNPKNKKEKSENYQIFYEILVTISKLMAPFIPFMSEYIYQSLKMDAKTSKQKLRIVSSESVHLCDYPKPNSGLIDKKIEKKMRHIRKIVELVLSKRTEAKIKIRQPLAMLKIKDKKIKEEELNSLIKEEVNVKEIVFDDKIEKEVELDTFITEELKKEGMAREIIRNIQDLRKKFSYQPKDKIKKLLVKAPKEIISVFKDNEEVILDTTGILEIEVIEKELEDIEISKEIKIDSHQAWIGWNK
ncbi:MAG: isoleucine--tRNA ligase [Candidatus Pacebacteria bacterium]|nr:isoleucine--tRNA ligase [Candidatus Paceibacterota bacterium]